MNVRKRSGEIWPKQVKDNAKYNKRKIYDMKPQDFIGKKATYDADGQIIWGEDA
jgi:hypothetical protein